MSAYVGPETASDGIVASFDAGNGKSHSANRFKSYGTGLTTENVTFDIQGTGTFQRVAAGTTIGGYTIQPSDVVYSYALGVNGCHYHGNSIAIPAGVRVTFSFDYLVTGATTYPINGLLANFENYGGGALSGSVSVPNNLQNIWQRVSFTAGPTSSAGTQAMFLYPGSCGNTRLADTGTLYYRNPKVEFTNVDTGPSNYSSMQNFTTWYNLAGTVNGTLSGGTQHYYEGYFNFDGIDDSITANIPSFFTTYSDKLTIEAWIYVPTGAVWNNAYEGVIVGRGNYAGSHGLFRSLTNNEVRAWFRQSGATYGAVSASGSITRDRWNQCVVTWTGTAAELYINGNLSQSSANTLTTTPDSSGEFVIGGANTAGGAGASYFSGRISNVKIYNRALSAVEVAQNFNALRGRFGI